MTPLDALVLDAEARQSLVTVRSLGRAGLRVGAFGSSRGAPARASRFCAVKGILPPVDRDPERFVAAVATRAAKHRAKVIITAHDGAIEALSERRGDVEAHARLALASNEALDVAVSKSKTLTVARKLGVRTPRTIRVDRMDEVDLALRELALPVVIKPERSWVFGAGTGVRLVARVAADPRAAVESIGAIVEVGGSALVQPWLSGRREAVSLLFAEDRVWARFAQVAHRMYPPLGGSSVLRESISLPSDIAQAAERLVRSIGLEGYSEVEFRRDAEGRPMLMEINPRLSASVEIAVRAGVDFPALLYAWAAGSGLRGVDAYRVGVRMRWLGGDVMWLKATLASQGLPDALPARDALAVFVRDSIRPAGYDYLDLADLRPLLVAGATPALQAVRRRWRTLARDGRRMRRRDVVEC